MPNKSEKYRITSDLPEKQTFMTIAESIVEPNIVHLFTNIIDVLSYSK